MPEPVTRDYFYRQAGIYVAANCRVLLVLWDGSPARPRGCGTAECVQLYEDGAFDLRFDNCMPKSEKQLIHILAPKLADGKHSDSERPGSPY